MTKLQFIIGRCQVIQLNGQGAKMLSQSPGGYSDRFIPLRNPQHLAYHDTSHFQTSPCSNLYSDLIRKNLLQSQHDKRLNYSSQTSSQASQSQTWLQNLHESQTSYASQSYSQGSQLTVQSQILARSSPVKVLQVPNYCDDYYLNTVDWSREGPMAIALHNQGYLYTPENLVEICRAPQGQYICSVKFLSSVLAIGLSNGSIQIYDSQRCMLLRTLHKHHTRVSGLTFINNSLLTGSKDGQIYLNDLRIQQHLIRRFVGHKGEICALKERDEHDTVFVSGSNDNMARLWDIRQEKTISKLKGHRGAVKAIAWCPWKRGVLATGGGCMDRSVKIWDTSSTQLLYSCNIQSQTSSMVWNQLLRSLVTSHGYNENQVKIWALGYAPGNDGCGLTLRSSFRAHSGRILNMVQSRDHGYLCTVGADERMKFWCVEETVKDPFMPAARRQTESFSRLL